MHLQKTLFCTVIIGLIMGFVGLAMPSAQGDTYSWTLNGTGLWSAGSNWSSGSAPASGNDYVVSGSTATCQATDSNSNTFAGTSLTVNNGATLYLYRTNGGTGITVNDYLSTFTLDGAKISVNSSLGTVYHRIKTASTLTGADSIVFGSATYTQDLYFDGAVSGSGSVAVTRGSSGNYKQRDLYLTGDCSGYSGNWTVTGYASGSYGILTIVASNAAGWGTGNLTLGNYGNLTVNKNATSSTSRLILNSASATATVNAGNTLSIGSISGLAGSSLTLAGSLSTGADNTSTAFAGPIGGAGRLTKNGSGTLTLSGTDTYTGGTIINAGGVQFAKAYALSGTGSVTVANNAALGLNIGGTSEFAATDLTTILGTATFNATSFLALDTTNAAGGSFYYSGDMTNANIGLVKNGAGLLTLGGNNSYAGGTTINGGALAYATTASVPGSGDFTVNSAGALAAVGPTGYTNASDWLNSGRIVTTSAGALAVVGSDNSAADLSGLGYNALYLGAVGAATYNGSLSPGSAGYLLGGGGGTLTVANNLTGSNGVTIAGNVNLAGSNSYTGTTTVNAGNVVVQNDQSAASGGWAIGTTNVNSTTVTVAPGATVAVAAGNQVQVGGTGGNYGTETLNVAGVLNNSGSFRVARVGVVNVNSGGVWNQSGDMDVEGIGGYSAAMTVNAGGAFNYSGVNPVRINGASANGGAASLTIAGTFATTQGFQRDVTPSTGAATVTLQNGGVLQLAGNVGQLVTLTGTPTMAFVLGSGGGVIDTQNYSTTMSLPISGAGSLTKLGAGGLTLTAGNSYAGTTTISAGTLALSGFGSVANSSGVSVAAGAVFDASAVGGHTIGAARFLSGAGTVIGSVTTSATDSAILPGGAAAVGTLTINGDLNLNGGRMTFDLSNNTNIGGADNDLINLVGSGNMNVNAQTIISLNPILGSLATSGTYRLANFAGSLNNSYNLQLDATLLTTRTTYTLDGSTPNQLNLGVTYVAPMNLTWSGSGATPGAWDINTTFNWNNGTQKFYGADNVTFDDSSSQTNITLYGDLLPGSVTVSSSQNYTFNGPGYIDGAIGLTKNGSGILTINSYNTFSDPVTINGGAVSVSSVSDSGTASPLGTAATTVLDGGTLQFTGFFASTNRSLVLGAGGGELDNVNAGNLLTLSGNVAVSSTADGNMTFGGSGDITLAGAIQTGSGSVTMNGFGTLTLNSSSSYTGTTAVNSGTLKVGNALALGSSAATVVVAAGATLDVNSINLGADAVTISGSGAGDAGAIINNGATQQTQALTNFALAGDATIGGNTRWDVRNPATNVTNVVNLNGNTLTKVGANMISLVSTPLTPGNLVINGGEFEVALAASTVTGTGTITVTSGSLALYSYPDGTTFTRDVVLNGGVLTSDGTGAVMNSNIGLATGTTSTINTPSSANLTLNGNLSGAGNINKTGAYSLFLGGDNSGFSGTFTSAQSNVFFNAPTAASAAAVWLINGGNQLAANFAGDGTLQLGSLAGTSGLLTSAFSGTKTFQIGAMGADGIFYGTIANGSGVLALTMVGSDTLTLAASNNYAGDTRIVNGTLALTNVAAASMSTVDMNIADSGSLSFGGMFSATLGGLKGGRNLDFSSVALSVGNNSQSTTYSGNLSGVSSSLTKIGTGTLTLTGSSGYDGATLISAGALAAEPGMGVPAASNVQLNGGVWQRSGSATLNVALGASGGELQWTSSGGFAAAGGKVTITLSGGDMTWGGTTFFTPSGNALLFSSATADSEVQLTNNINLNSATQTVSVAAGLPGSFATLSGNISGDAYSSLTKTGPGRLVLSGSNSYGGATTVNGGTLDIPSANSFPSGTSLNFTGNGTLLNLGTVSAVSASITGLSVGNSATASVTGGNSSIAIAATGDFRLGGTSASTSQGLDMSALGSFSYNGPAYTFDVGGQYSGSASSNARGTLWLAATNNITANVFGAANVNASYSATNLNNVSVGTIYLGVDNAIAANTIWMAYDTNRTAATGTMEFAPGTLNPTLSLSGTAAGSRVNLTLGAILSSSYPNATGTIDLVTGVTGTSTLSAMIGQMVLGYHVYSSNSAQPATGNFNMGAGTLDANTIILGQSLSTSGVGSGNGQFSLDGGSVLANTITVGDRANNSAATVSGTFSLNSGLLSANLIQSGSGTGTRVFNWTSGTVANYNPAYGLGNDFPESGLTVSIPSMTITSTAAHVFWIDADQTGTVSAAIGEAGGSAGLTKAGPGALTLSGTNTYTGGTTVADGTLIATNPLAIEDGTNLTIGNGALFPAAVVPQESIAAGASVLPVAAVPEPGTLVLLIAGAVIGIGLWRRKMPRSPA
jgi:fibronectin-binding autotransporter adhesin